MKQHYIIPGILSLIALYWVYMAVTSYGIWTDEGPGGGFMPLLAALIIIGFSIAAIVKPGGKEKPWYVTVFIPVGLVIAVICIVPVVGFLASLSILIFCWLKWLEHYSWGFSLLLSVCVIGVVWLVFEAWLRVPFPTGMLGF